MVAGSTTAFPPSTLRSGNPFPMREYVTPKFDYEAAESEYVRKKAIGGVVSGAKWGLILAGVLAAVVIGIAAAGFLANPLVTTAMAVLANVTGTPVLSTVITTMVTTVLVSTGIGAALGGMFGLFNGYKNRKEAGEDAYTDFQQQHNNNLRIKTQRQQYALQEINNLRAFEDQAKQMGLPAGAYDGFLPNMAANENGREIG